MRWFPFISAAALSASWAASVSPIQKVVQLLGEMSGKGKKAMNEEAAQFAAYNQFCLDTSQEKANAIATSTRQIEDAISQITVSIARIQDLTTKIEENDAQIGHNQADVKAASAVRKEENDHFLKTEQDYSESIDAIIRAINVLQKQNYDRQQQAPALLEVAALSMVPLFAQKKIQRYINTGATDDSFIQSDQAPEADAYEFQSGSVIDMLEKLKDKFIDERDQLQKEEANSNHAYNMLIQDLTNDTKNRESESENMSTQRADSQQAKGEAEGNKVDAEAAKAADEKYKSELDATCAQKSSDYESRRKLREEELAAIAQAVDILSSDTVSGAAQKHGLQLASINSRRVASIRKVSLIQADSVNFNTIRAAEFLRKQGVNLNSRVLSTLAVRLESSTRDPFAKVTQMIKNLITRLQKEGAEEADQNEWCKKNLAENEADRKQFKGDVKKYSTRAQLLSSKIAKLGDEVKDLRQQVQQAKKDLAAANKLRTEQKQENEQTIQDAQAAQAAVNKALVVLKQFYEKAAKATSFIQQTPPEIFSDSYKGLGGESTGVVGLLEVIQGDFARLEASTTASENEAASEHDKFVNDTNLDVSVKQNDIKNKSTQIASSRTNLNNAKADRKASQLQLDGALDTYEKLKPTCVESGFSYEQRVQRRKEEIESLKDALEILSNSKVL